MIFLPNLIPNKIEPKIIPYLLVVNSANQSDYYRIIASTLRKYLSDNESKWLWNKIAIELEKLSKIVENRLRNYNKPAKGLAIAMDFNLGLCIAGICSLISYIFSYPSIIKFCPACELVASCIVACFSGIGVWVCLGCVGAA